MSQKLRLCLASCKEVVHDNAGLLLITLAQAFSSIMNVSVKKLNGLDDPVPTLEVRVMNSVNVTESSMLMPFLACLH